MRALLLLALIASPAMAQEAPETSCANVRVALPAELAGWSEQTPVSAGTKTGDGATIALGKAALVSLHAAKFLALTPAPKTTDGNGGTLAFSVAKAGTYRVALGGAAWVDLVQAGKPVDSTAHAHGPKCSGVRKVVDFQLTPGTYTIQLSGSDADSVALMVAKLG